MDPPTNESQETAASLKEQGNACVKKGQFKEAALFYSYAIKLEANNETLYSNRSLVYLKLGQYALALEDAHRTIDINPQWPKGYFRKGEALFSSGSHRDAVIAYEKALELLPSDPNIIEAILKANEALRQERESKDKLVWVCSCIGLILGVVLTLLDYTLSDEPTLKNPLLQVVFVQVIAGSFWLAAYTLLTYRNHSKTVEVQEVENSSSYYILIGSVLGGSIVVIDATSYEILGLKTSAGRIFVTLICAGLGWIMAIIFRHLKKQSMEDEAAEEEDVQDEQEPEEGAAPEKQPSNKYTKAQARHRYKKGKML